MQMKILLKIRRIRKHSGQSLVELALILPLILLMLAGMVEVAFGMFAYLTALDLTREAARFASMRDYTVLDPGGTLHPSVPPSDFVTDPSAACLDGTADGPILHYYYDSACFFTDPKLNPFLEINPAKYDDLVITVFTVANNVVTARHPDPSDLVPGPGYWNLYTGADGKPNWQKDCQGTWVNTPSFFDEALLQLDFQSLAPADRGIVLVEAYICYDMIMNLPFISNFIPSPFRIHAYTVMPAPDGLPTPTPIP
jgi:hypothetical protein